MTAVTGVPPDDAIPEPRYRALRYILGRPRRTSEELAERLHKPVALAILSSDALSSVAYADEEMLKVLLPVAAAASFRLVPPLALGIVALLLTLTFSYRQTIKAYPSAGGAYIVTKDNFGLGPAQVAGIALLLDYVMTVAVSVAAGVAAVYSTWPSFYPYRVPVAVVLIWMITWGNLRGVRATGKLFASPTYVFLGSMFALLGVGLFRMSLGHLHHIPAPHPLPSGTLSGVTLFVLAHAYASGTTALTGVEAISNGVPVFRPPEWRNARTVLTWMGALLAVLFAGLSLLAWKLHPVPTGKETLVSEVGRAVFGRSPVGHALFLVLQVATTAILVLAANTSFADFPRLASFAAADGYLPAPLRRRGRRLGYSYGILALAGLATVITVVLGADVHRLIPLYAVGAFASFTFSQAGMTRRHLRLREEGWRHSLVINGLGACGSGLALVAVLVTKFRHGAWVVTIVVPLGVWMTMQIHRHYTAVKARLAASDDVPSEWAGVVVVEREGVTADDVRRLVGDVAVQMVASNRHVKAAVQTMARPHTTVLVALGPAVRVRQELLIRRLAHAHDVAFAWMRPPEHDDLPRAAIVLVEDVDVRARDGMALARLLGEPEVHPVCVDIDPEDTQRIVDGWTQRPPLEVLTSPYRQIAGPLAWKVAVLRAQGRRVDVVLPELSPRWWQRPLYRLEARPARAAALTNGAELVIQVPVPLDRPRT